MRDGHGCTIARKAWELKNASSKNSWSRVHATVAPSTVFLTLTRTTTNHGHGYAARWATDGKTALIVMILQMVDE